MKPLYPGHDAILSIEDGGDDVFLGSHAGKDYWIDTSSESNDLIIIISDAEQWPEQYENLGQNDFHLPEPCLPRLMLLKLKGISR